MSGRKPKRKAKPRAKPAVPPEVMRPAEWIGDKPLVMPPDGEWVKTYPPIQPTAETRIAPDPPPLVAGVPAEEVPLPRKPGNAEWYVVVAAAIVAVLALVWIISDAPKPQPVFPPSHAIVALPPIHEPEMSLPPVPDLPAESAHEPEMEAPPTEPTTAPTIQSAPPPLTIPHRHMSDADWLNFLELRRIERAGW